jgi:NO-binding membrane sensor protein with MHYT domain
MTFQILCIVAATLWLASVAACTLAFRWSALYTPKRFLAAIILSLAALVVGYLGMTRFHLVASKTVNGEVQWRFDSMWFFITTLILAAATLAFTVWKRISSPQAEQSRFTEPGDDVAVPNRTPPAPGR